MTTDVTAIYRTPGRAGVLDRLVVRGDMLRRGFFLIIASTSVFAIVMLCLPVLAITHSHVLAGLMLAWSAGYFISFVASAIRAFYCYLRPYLTPRWLAAAHAVYGDDVMTPVLAKLRARFSLDHVLHRQELIDEIYLHRLLDGQARKAAHGMRMRDVAGQG